MLGGGQETLFAGYKNLSLLAVLTVLAIQFWS